MATLPTRLVEVEFDAGVWTNVAADVVNVATRRGRNRELGAFETGQMVVTLRNDGRTYDPDNTAGPYYGKLRPNRRVRFRATYNAVTYPVFLGYVDRITQIYGGPNDATAEIQVSDQFKILNRVELPSSAYVAEVEDDGPVALWRLDEPDGSTVVKDSAGTLDLDVYGAPDFGATTLVARDPGTAMTITDQATQAVWRYPVTLPATGPPITLELVFQKTVAGTTGALVGLVAEPLTQGALWLFSTGTIVAMQAANGAGAQQTVTTTGVNLDDGLVHHIVGRWEAGGALRIFVDGVNRTSGSPTLAATAFTNTTGFVHAAGTPPGVHSGPAHGTYQMVAIYNTALSDARIAGHAAEVATPWTGDLPGTRLVRIFDLAGGGTYEIDPGTTTLQSTGLGGTALAYAQKVELTEAGRLFVTADGTVRFIDRQSALTGDYLTSQATLVDADSGAGLPYTTTGADVDEATIVTRATVSREESVAVTYQDDAAVAEFEIIDMTLEGLLHDDDDYSRSYAEWLVNTQKTPYSRVGQVTLELAADPATMYPGILGLEIADRVTYKRKPQNTGAVFSQDMRVEAISHETGGHYWRTHLQLSKFYLTTSGSLWVLGVAGNSELGQTTTLGF